MSWQVICSWKQSFTALATWYSAPCWKISRLTNSSGTFVMKCRSFSFFHFVLNLKKIYWNIVNLKCFKYAAKWFSYMYMCVYIYYIFVFKFFSIVDYYKDIKYSSLFSTVGPCYLFYIYIVVLYLILHWNVDFFQSSIFLGYENLHF